jgi:hypothetical protein
MVQAARVEKSVDELLEKIAADNAELFGLLATNGRNSRKK